MPLNEAHEVLYRAGQLDFVCNLPDAAIAELAKALEFDASWPAAYSFRAETYRRLGRFQESIADLTKSIELAPSRSGVHTERGQIYLRMREFDRALPDFDRGIQAAPDNAWAHNSRGDALHRLGRTAEALQAYDKAVSLSPRTVESRAWAYVALGRLDEALADMDKLIALTPSSPSVYIQRALLLTFKPGSCDRAVADLRKARELVPPSAWDAWTCLVQAIVHVTGLFYECPKEYDPREALDFALKAVTLAHTDPGVRGTLGLALYRNGRYEAVLPRDGEPQAWKVEGGSRLLRTRPRRAE